MDKRAREGSDFLHPPLKRFHCRLMAFAKIFAIESCRDAIHFTSVPWQIPLEKSKLHLSLIMINAVSGARFLTGGVVECDISHHWSVAVLFMLYKIRCNPVHPLYGALPGPYVPVRVTRGALVAHRYTYALPRCRTLQYSRTFIPFSVSLWNNLANPVFDGVGLAGFKNKANASLLA